LQRARRAALNGGSSPASRRRSDSRILVREDTPAFANPSARGTPTARHLAHYCFVLARGVRQFTQFARFDPSLPKLDPAGYIERVGQPWRCRPDAALPLDDWIVVPGYANLREFSRARRAPS
jgi:hypothetical protein